MKRSQALQFLRNGLKQASIAEADQEAILALSAFLSCDATDLYLHGEKPVPPDLLPKMEWLMEQRKAHVPLAYLLGERWFYGMRLAVAPGVLIPRQETELLADLAIGEMQAGGAFLELCTGSGAVAIAVAKETSAPVWATDISPAALAIAKENAKRQNAPVHFLQGDLFAGVQGKFHCIAANPPYIESHLLEQLQPEVQKEPRLALDGGADGLFFYRRIAEKIGAYLAPGGTILLEIGAEQGKRVQEIFAAHGFSNGQVQPDLAGRDRIIRIRT